LAAKVLYDIGVFRKESNNALKMVKQATAVITTAIDETG